MSYIRKIRGNCKSGVIEFPGPLPSTSSLSDIGSFIANFLVGTQNFLVFYFDNNNTYNSGTTESMSKARAAVAQKIHRGEYF